MHTSSSRLGLIALVVSGLGVLSGCSTYAAPRYAASADNVAVLRTLKGQAINVGKFTAKGDEEASITCRAVGPIETPDGEPFSEYVRKALISELRMADVYAPTGPVTLTGTLDNVEFSSTGGTWELALTVTSSNGKRIHVEETYDYHSSFVGETACNQTAQAFMPGVQDLIAKLVKHPGFKALVAAPQPVASAGDR